MASLSLRFIAASMRKMDICMMVTQTVRRGFNSRPMSNNRDVTYKGSSYFFTFEDSQKIREIESNPYVCLNYEGAKGLFVSISGKAKLIRNKTTFEKHWVKGIERWFQQGVDTPGLVLIHVKGSKLRYWQKEKEGEIKLIA